MRAIPNLAPRPNPWRGTSTNGPRPNVLVLAPWRLGGQLWAQRISELKVRSRSAERSCSLRRPTQRDANVRFVGRHNRYQTSNNLLSVWPDCAGPSAAPPCSPMADSPIIATVPLAFQWPTLDPFLFCVHHDDAYPAGNDQLGPAASLAGSRARHGLRRQGRLAHVSRRGRAGLPAASASRLRDGDDRAPAACIDHSDSLGATARFGRGDVQWLTAGKGISHCEMFPLVDASAPNPVELFQIWLNLPSRDKMVEPHFTMLWEPSIPRIEAPRRAGPRRRRQARRSDAAVAAAELVGVARRSGPRDLDDQARRGRAVDAAAGARPGTNRILYVFQRHGEDRRSGHRRADRRAGEARGARSRSRRRTRPRSSCCRASRSASRSRSTARS